MWSWIFAILILTYCLGVIYLWLGWEQLPITLVADETTPKVTVLIPVRNEAPHIQALLMDISRQNYAGDIEILVIDDHSTDNTAAIVTALLGKIPNLTLLPLAVGREGKKVAITQGVSEAGGTIVLTTDGDCRVAKGWVAAMLGVFKEDVHLVSGPVKFTGSRVWNKMLQLEFSALIASGAAFIGLGKPVMANGANLAFRKQTFLNVHGFEGNENTASGDDVFLLHKILDTYGGGIAFAKNTEAMVRTQPPGSFLTFIQQRVRWAGKWRAYTQLFTQLVALGVALVSITVLVAFFYVLSHCISPFLYVNLLVVKAFFDYLFLRAFARFWGDKVNLLRVLILQIIHPVYVVFTAFFSLQKKYVWKGRKVKS